MSMSAVSPSKAKCCSPETSNAASRFEPLRARVTCEGFLVCGIRGARCERGVGETRQAAALTWMIDRPVGVSDQAASKAATVSSIVVRVASGGTSGGSILLTSGSRPVHDSCRWGCRTCTPKYAARPPATTSRVCKGRHRVDIPWIFRKNARPMPAPIAQGCGPFQAMRRSASESSYRKRQRVYY